MDAYAGDAWLGIDCGSTTTKLLLLSAGGEILYTYYASNRGNPLDVVKGQLTEIYRRCGDRIAIRGSAVTGYGEALIRSAFNVDIGIVETFAKSMGVPIDEFARRGLKSRAPVNLGSRCTVFMNSSVKQAQKDGATLEDISAGLSISVVKNAIYKVIRAGDPSELGEHIVVQGGTFHNDAVLRAFERELGREVTRPAIAGLMGAYGAALCARKCRESRLIGPEELAAFTHTSKTAVCGICTNHCHLTVNTFSGGKKYISGNRCERGLGIKRTGESVPNLYAWKREKLLAMQGGVPRRGRVGLPLGLGMYELLPLWNGVFQSLGFEVVLPEMSTRRTYEKGQFSIPSDTVCYPAKLMHGHVAELLEKGVDAIFYPCLSYNVDERAAENHYNCPVVAYYSELLQGNVDDLQQTKFLYPYLNINNEKELARELAEYLDRFFPGITLKETRAAVKAGFRAYEDYMAALRAEGERALRYAREKGMRLMILAGRPYHVDAEISHGIDSLAVSLGFVVASEDSVCHLAEPQKVRVLNQWTYHARLYRAAAWAGTQPDVELVQLVSFGCGVDAITTDEVRAILEKAGKFYTQIKIDEITNLGAVNIRLRSLIGALDMEREAQHG